MFQPRATKHKPIHYSFSMVIETFWLNHFAYHFSSNLPELTTPVLDNSSYLFYNHTHTQNLMFYSRRSLITGCLLFNWRIVQERPEIHGTDRQLIIYVDLFFVLYLHFSVFIIVHLFFINILLLSFTSLLFFAFSIIPFFFLH